MADAVDGLIDRYRQLAIEWAQADDAHSANRLIMEQQEVYRRLTGMRHGREALSRLLDDPHDGVRLAAASHALAWHDPAAIAILEELQAGDDLRALDARLVLHGYRNGLVDADL